MKVLILVAPGGHIPQPWCKSPLPRSLVYVIVVLSQSTVSDSNSLLYNIILALTIVIHFSNKLISQTLVFSITFPLSLFSVSPSLSPPFSPFTLSLSLSLSLFCLRSQSRSKSVLSNLPSLKSDCAQTFDPRFHGCEASLKRADLNGVQQIFENPKLNLLFSSPALSLPFHSLFLSISTSLPLLLLSLSLFPFYLRLQSKQKFPLLPVPNVIVSILHHL